MREYRKCEVCGEPLLIRAFYRKSGRLHSYYEPRRFCSWKCAGKYASKLGQAAAAANPRGRFIDKHGYVILTARAGEGGYQQPEHRAVMERMLGRKLLKGETVHHKNGVKHDNRPENLELWSGRHGRGQRVSDLQPMMASGSLLGLMSLSH